MGEEKGAISIDETCASIFQILSTYHILEDEKMKSYCNSLMSEWKGNAGMKEYDLNSIFKNINKKLRTISLEIRTVAIRSDDSGNHEEDQQQTTTTSSSSANSHWTYYHGLVNTEEDLLSKEFGNNQFSTVEFKLFSLLTIQLAMLKQMNTNDIIKLNKNSNDNKLSQSEIYSFLQKLENSHWLSKNLHNYYILGPRSFLELQSYLETSIREGNISGLEDFTDVEREDAVKSLPSLRIY
jgi:hypothetical protein